MSFSNPMHHDMKPLKYPPRMNRRAARAYNKLESMGVPVYVHADDAPGMFSIDAEAPGAERWLDYYGDASRLELVFGISIDVERVLQQNELRPEWVNPGRVAVYDDI